MRWRGRLVGLGAFAFLVVSTLAWVSSGTASPSASASHTSQSYPPAPSLAMRPASGGPWKAQIEVIQKTDRRDRDSSGAIGSGMVGTAKLVWSSAGTVGYKNGDQTITLKGKGRFSAVASGKVVGGCTDGSAMGLSLSASGAVTTTINLTFSTIAGKPGVFGVTTPQANWTGVVRQTCSNDASTADYGDVFYSTYREGSYLQRRAATGPLVLKGSTTSAISSGTQTVRFTISCTNLKACLAPGATKPPAKRVPTYFKYKATKLPWTCEDAPGGTRRVVVGTEMYVANRGPTGVTDVKGATEWVKEMRVEVRLEQPTGLNPQRPWIKARTGALQQFSFNTNRLTVRSDNVLPDADDPWVVHVKYIWDRPQPVPDIVIDKKYPAPACFTAPSR